jgi:hypothetical protein
MKLMSVVLLVAIAVYIGIYIYDRADNPLKTALAVRYTAEENGDVDGYIVRDETVLTGGGGTVSLLASEGEKVASGETLAVFYQGASALERANEIRALQLQISAAEAAAGASSAGKQGSAADSVLELSDAIQHKDFENLPSLSITAENMIFTGAGDAAPVDDLPALQNRLNDLLGQATDSITIAAPMSGVFSAVVDGYEAVGPDALRGLTPASLRSLFGSAAPPGEVLGKLISGITWYFAAVMDAGDAAKLQAAIDKAAADENPEQAVADIQFTNTYNTMLQMKIEDIGEAEDGKCVVIFTSKSNMSDITALRRLTGQVLFSSFTGLLVPKEAVYHEDGGKSYVYLLTALQAEKVYVTILCENGDSYVVEDGIESGTVLREGSEIIVKAKDLYDGKVVNR